MAQTTWANVLVEWVNCLKLSKSVDFLEDLKDGIFYKKLLKIIGSPQTHGNTTHFIVNLLKTQYPNFLFDIDDIDTWADVSYKDLITVTSLLLHHSCITDGREVLTSPLCHKLSQTTQLCIKLFLEKVDFDVTRETLNEVINLCVASRDKTSSSSSTEYEDTPLNCNSPLQDLLTRTPKFKNSRLIEKEREIKQLKNDLDLERFEKADLQEEFKLLQEKNDKLNKEISVKVQENKKLRYEILALQNKTPPHFVTEDTVQIQRKLKTEIEHLEHYVSQLEKEQCDLEQQLKITNEKVKKFEVECYSWQSKSISLETTNENLCEIIEQQRIEISNLHSHNEELSAMLDDLKTHEKSSESLLNWVTGATRRSLGSTCEDLAHTVIDVQLKDVQKENDDLRNSLNEHAVKIKELHDIKTKYEKLEIEFCELQEFNAGLSKSCISIQEASQKLEDTCKKLTYENGALLEEIERLSIDVRDCKAIYASAEHELSELREKRDIMESELKEVVEDLKMFVLNEQEFEIDSKVPLDKLKTLSKQVVKYKEESLNEMETCRKRIEILESENSIRSDKLKALSDTLNTEVSLKLDLEKLVENLKEEKLKAAINLKEEKETSQKKVEELTIKVNEILDENKRNTTEMVNCQAALLKIDDELREKTKRIEALLATITDLEGKCAQQEDALKDRVLELDDKTKELCLLNIAIEKLETEQMSHLEEIKALKDKNTNILKKCDVLHKNVCDLEETNSKQNGELKALSEALNTEVSLKIDLEKLLENLKEEKLKAVIGLKEENETLQRKVGELTMKVEEILDESKRNITEIEEELEEKTKRIEVLLTTITDLEEKCAQQEDVLKELDGKSKEQNIEIEKLETEKLLHLEEIKALKDENTNILNKCDVLHKNVCDLEETNSKQNGQLKVFNEALNTEVSLKIDLEKLVENLKEEKLKAVMSLKEEKATLEKKVEELTMKLNEILDENKRNTTEMANCQAALLKIEDELEEKNKRIEVLCTTNTGLEAQLDHVKAAQEKDKLHCQTVLIDLKEKCAQQEDVLKELDGKSKEQNIEIEKLQTEKLLHLEEIKALKDESTNILNKCDVLHKNVCDLEETNSKQNGELKVFNEALNTEVSLKISLEKLVENLKEEKLKAITSLKEEKETLENKVEELTVKMNAVLDENKLNITSLANCQAALIKVEDELEEKTKRIEALLATITDLVEKCAQQEDVLKELDGKSKEQNIEIEKLETEKLLHLEEIKALKDENTNILKKCEVLHRNVCDLEETISKQHIIQSTLQEKETETQHLNATLQTQMKDILNERDAMNATINNFDLKEIRYLQDINELKDELTKTTNKYTESLQLQQELKTENDIQIANLTETLHDLVSKYNECENKYAQLDIEKVELQKCMSERECDIRNNCGELIMLIHELKRCLNNDSENDCLNSESNIEHCKVCLKSFQLQFLAALKTFENYKNDYVALNSLLLQQKETVETKELEIEKLTKYQKQLECDVGEWKKRCEEDEAVMNDYENRIINTKCAQEILETGKEILEQELISCRAVLKEREQEYTEAVFKNNLKLESLECELKQVREICQQKELQQQEEQIKLKQEKEMLLEACKKANQYNEDLMQQLQEVKLEKQKLMQELETTIYNDGIVKDLVREYKDILTEKTEALNSMQLTLQNNEQNIVELNKELLASQKEKKELVEHLEMQQTKIEQKEEEVKNKLSQELMILETSNSKLQGKCDELETVLERLNSEKRKFSENVNKIESVLSLEDCGGDLCHADRLANILNQVMALQEKFGALELTNRELEKLAAEKNTLASDIETLQFKYTETRKALENLQLKYDLLQAKNEQMSKYRENSEEKQKTIIDLQNEQSNINTSLTNLCDQMKTHKRQLERLFSASHTVELLLGNIKQTLREMVTINEIKHKHLFERKESLEILTDDISKQANKFSKKLGNLVCTALQIYQNAIADFLSGKHNISSAKLNIDEALESSEDLKDRAEDTLHQVNILNKDIHLKFGATKTDVLKENIINGTVKLKEDELKRTNMILKQRATLAENAKSNLERKIKQLREENKKLHENMSLNFVSKAEHERILNANTVKYKNLLLEYEELASKSVDVLQEKDGKMDVQYRKLQEAYGNLMSEKSQLELELENTKNTSEFSLIKERYEKVLEENNKLMMECDTLNYKRTRDREEFAKLLQIAKEESETRESNRVREIRSEYETKLEKMKEKMIKLYTEEVDKEMQKLTCEKNENVFLMRNIQQLREHLQESNLKLRQVEIERDRAIDRLKYLQQKNDICRSRESLRSVSSRDGDSAPRGARASKAPSNSVAPLITQDSIPCKEQDSKFGSLTINNGPRDEEDARISSQASGSSVPSEIGQNLKMEDEEDDFNNKYLSDLKEGKCVLPTEQGCNAGRISELAWRNSLCLPHLKSSYPAELQFVSPRRFKEDDIKTGNIDLDDSMSTKLLPGEKVRNKKDVGTTSYKKPGPPTPSKNGGRLSLVGSEARDPLQGQNCEVKTPKRATPKRIKALFMGRNAISKEHSENQSTTPRAKRLSSIFRKGR